MSDFHVEAVSNSSKDAALSEKKGCVIRVIGIGGGGGNALQHMINQSVDGVDFIAINTDAQALGKSSAGTKVQIGVKLTNGLGAGCDPNIGRKAAEESREDIKHLLDGSDLIFVTAGMGGGTGTGAASVIAEISKTVLTSKNDPDDQALVVAVVTKPFKFEGKKHMINAQAGIAELSKHVDSLIVIDNDKLLKNLGANISILNAFNEANDVLLNAVRGITDSINNTGYMNLDFSDVKTVMRGRGHAMIGSGHGQGANFVEDAIQKAIHSPLIEQVDISSAAGLLVNAVVNPNFPINKWDQISAEIQSYADEDADCKFGIIFNDNYAEDEISVTILITGISSSDNASSESPAALSRASNLRRTAPLDAPSGGFFRMSEQNRVNQNTMTNASFGQRENVQSMPNTIRQSGMGIEPAEVPVNNQNMSQEMWEVPPILRNRAD